jgi:hypothetical protein
MASVNITGDLTKNEQILKSISMDSISGIQTVIDSLNTPGVIMVTEESRVIEPVSTQPVIEVKELPSVVITPVPNNKKNSVIDNNEVIRRIERLSNKDKNIVIFSLVGLSVILLLIAIFK